MFNKKILCGILCAVMLFSAVSVAASNFADVDGDPTVSWAVPYINEMSEKGYIKGYEDGTFKPNNTISKTEALILLSRMLGVNNSDFAESVEYAVSEFKSTLSGYSTNYAKEVSFLLYAGVLKADELDAYLSSSNKNAALKRYEAAILLTKLLGAEGEVSSNAFVSSSYADTVDIPDSARAYVEYVKDQGIMQGMGNNDDGDPIFSPNTYVTRSQMAKMLCCLIDVINLSSQTGTFLSVDEFNETISLNIDGKDVSKNLSAEAKFKVDGKDAEYNKIKKGMQVKVTYIADKIALVEKQTVLTDTVIYGLVSVTKDSGSTKSVTIVDANDSSIKDTYILTEDAKVRVNGAIDLFSKIKANQYVALTLEDGLVTALEVVEKTTTVYGTLIGIDASGSFTILNVMDNSGNTVDCEVSSKELQVSRNSLSASISDLMIGDTVSLRLTYGKVTKIQASSSKQNNSGSISYITHSTEGTVIGIEANGDVKEYKVNKSVKITIDSSESGTVYDLRPGTDIEIRLESQEIIAIQTASVVVKSTLNGIVKTINATYGLMVVEENGVEYNVFTNGSTKIIDSTTGKNILLKNVEKNRTASVTGSTASGVLEASVIVLQ